MRKLNEVTKDTVKESLLEQNHMVCAPIYQCGDDSTDDPEKADKDVFGNPITIGFDSKHLRPHSVYSLQNPVSFDPKNPEGVLTALSARDSMLKNTSKPQVYLDKFELSKFADSQTKNFVTAYNEKVKQLNSKHDE